MQSVKEFLHVGRGRCTLLFTEQPHVKKLIKYWKMIKYKIQQSACWSTGIALEYAAYSSAPLQQAEDTPVPRLFGYVFIYPERTQSIPVVNLNRFPFLWLFYVFSEAAMCRQMVFVTQGSRQLFVQRFLFPHENHPKIPLCRLPHVLSASCVGLGTYPGCISSPTPLQHPPVTTVTS